MPQLHLFSGGAAQGLVTGLADRFATETGYTIDGSFGAVGMMKDKLLGGAPCDVLVLTQSLIDELTRDGHVRTGSARPVGVVRTGVAVKTGQPLPDTSDPDALKALLLGARGIYFPDPVKSTAGIHVMKVLKALGIDQQLAGQLRPYPNGATAMREMSQCNEDGLIGCTQVTEILFAPGVTLAGMLPKAFELATVYTAGVCSQSAAPDQAAAFIDRMIGEPASTLRRSCGFE